MAFDMSKAAFGKATNLEKVRRIPLGLIKSNEQNFYSIEGIEELADSIAMVGLLEPVRVVAIPHSPTQPYEYKLISGHRRFRAFMVLYSRKEEGYLQYAEIPALVMEDMDDLTETFALITANATAREISYAEKLKQEQLLRETLTAMKEAGQNIPKNLGQYIADQIGTSRNEVSRMHSINQNLIPEAREKVDRGEMTAQQAYELSRKPEQEQRETVGTSKPQRFTEIDQEEINKKVAALKAATHLLDDLLDRVRVLHAIVDRSTGIMELKAGLKRLGSFGDITSWITAQDVTLAVTNHGDKFRTITPSELWDAMSIAAMQRCANLSKLDTEEEDAAPSPAGQLWHTEDPTEGREYLVMYQIVGGGKEPRPGIMRWTDEGWTQHGGKIAGILEVKTWTEVPEC